MDLAAAQKGVVVALQHTLTVTNDSDSSTDKVGRGASNHADGVADCRWPSVAMGTGDLVMVRSRAFPRSRATAELNVFFKVTSKSSSRQSFREL